MQFTPLLRFFLAVCVCVVLFVSVVISANSPSLGWKPTPSGFEELKPHAWDFEFDERQDHDEESESANAEKSLKIASDSWAENDLCRNLQCKPHQVCLVKEDDVAICVSKRKLKVKDIKENSIKPAYNSKKEKETIEDGSEEEELMWERNEDSNVKKDQFIAEQDGSSCIPCPVVKPEFVCGSDNQTYSSVCRLDFRNCMHKTTVSVGCKGFCPCKTLKSDGERSKEKQMKERWNRYMSKYHSTVNKQHKLQKTLKQDSKIRPDIEKNNSNNKERAQSNENKEHQQTHNSVLRNKNSPSITTKSCTEDELRAMGDRLLDWFSVVMSDHRRGQSRRRSFRLSHTQLPDCKPEVNWMFQHLDTDGDVKLSMQELYDLEHDDREQCLRPYLLDCDVDRDMVLSPYEWCSCFDKSQRPCAAALKRAPQGLLGAYMPQCDGEGYYFPTQCHSGSGTCWCVDKHGVEFTNTRRRGRPDCEGLLRRGQYHIEETRGDDDDDDDDDQDDTEEEGSADRPLDF